MLYISIVKETLQELTGTDGQKTDEQDHVLSQAYALTKKLC